MMKCSAIQSPTSRSGATGVEFSGALFGSVVPTASSGDCVALAAVLCELPQDDATAAVSKIRDAVATAVLRRRVRVDFIIRVGYDPSMTA